MANGPIRYPAPLNVLIFDVPTGASGGALQNQVTSKLPNGALAFVNSTRQLFYLDRFSAEAPSDECVRPIAGPGRWLLYSTGASTACERAFPTFYLNSFTEVPEADQDGSLCRPYGSIEQVATAVSDPAYDGQGVTMYFATGSYQGALLPGNRTYALYGAGSAITGLITISGVSCFAYFTEFYFSGGGIETNADEGEDSFGIFVRDCRGVFGPDFPLFVHGDLWIGGTLPNVARGFQQQSYCVVGDIEASGEVQLSNCIMSGTSLKCARFATQSVQFTAAVQIETTANGGEAGSLSISRDTWFQENFAYEHTGGGADDNWGIDGTTNYSMSLVTPTLTNVDTVIEDSLT